MSVIKLLSRIVAPKELEEGESTNEGNNASHAEAHSFGITSDPLTQFACAFSALIHDADHTGLPNATLVEEKTRIAAMYKNRSVAEQNSLDISWDLLMEDRFAAFRSVIFQTKDEQERFRALVTNSVMATDIADKDLGAARKARWNKAFNLDTDVGESSISKENPQIAINRKATIVIEHLIQASDISHTMQHWKVYIKWNRYLFNEMYGAFKAGKTDKDPSIGWYKGELGFFDFYIIPLAKKLRECGVFGVSSDEFLNYARANRIEWEEKGEEIVEWYLSEWDDQSSICSAKG